MPVSELYQKYTLDALQECYISVYVFDLVGDTITAVKTNPFIVEWSGKAEGVQGKVRSVMDNITVSEHLQSITEFTDISTLRERLKDNVTICSVFKGKLNGWCKARFIRIDDGRTDDGEIRYVLYVVECIDEEKKQENYLRYLAQTDLMTGIRNRGYGEQAIESLLSKDRKGLFCLFDIDKFKQFNDRYGHHVGDKVLVETAGVLQRMASKEDVIARLGGDEFLAYFVDIDNQDAAMKTIDRLFKDISEIKIEGVESPISISLGAVFSTPGCDFDSMYRLADKGVYDSKLKKGNSFSI